MGLSYGHEGVRFQENTRQSVGGCGRTIVDTNLRIVKTSILTSRYALVSRTPRTPVPAPPEHYFLAHFGRPIPGGLGVLGRSETLLGVRAFVEGVAGYVVDARVLVAFDGSARRAILLGDRGYASTGWFGGSRGGTSGGTDLMVRGAALYRRRLSTA
jgi:hypothetical protein